MTKMTWTHQEAIAAEGKPCWLCAHRTDGVRRTAVTLGAIVGFYSVGGGGSVRLEPICEEHTQNYNVVPCMGSAC